MIGIRNNYLYHYFSTFANQLKNHVNLHLTMVNKYKLINKENQSNMTLHLIGECIRVVNE